MTEIHEHARRSIARMTLPELDACLGQVEDALQVADNPHAPMLAALGTAYQTRINQLRGIGDTRPAPEVDDVQVGRRAGSAAGNQYGTFAVHAATPAQVGFLQRLINTKDTTGIVVPTTLEGISKKAASALIDKLIDRPGTSTDSTLIAHSGPRPASEKQANFVRKLVAERDWAGVVDGLNVDTQRTDWIEKLTGSQASKVIDTLLSAPRKSIATQATIAAGAYRVNGRVIRVYLGQQSGRMLAAELVDASAHIRDEAWQYLGAAERFVAADAHRMTVEECEQVAGSGQADHGWCCVCGRDLDDPNSVKRGIGPVCRAKQGM